jgi:hypothetical protein
MYANATLYVGLKCTCTTTYTCSHFLISKGQIRLLANVILLFCTRFLYAYSKTYIKCQSKPPQVLCLKIKFLHVQDVDNTCRP